MAWSQRLTLGLVSGTILAALPATSRAQQATQEATACSKPPTSAPLPTPTPEQTQADEVQIHTDWANVARYREANALLTPPKPGEKRVVFIGNSITEGWAPSFATLFPGKPYVGRGVGGQTTPQMLVRFRQDVIALAPSAVVILGGTNDIAENTGPSTVEMIEDNLASMSELAKANGIRVVLASVLPVFKYSWRPSIDPPFLILKLNAWMRDYSAKKGFVYLDFESTMADERHGLKCDLTFDGVHPNTSGYRVMSQLAERAIAEALSSAR